MLERTFVIDANLLLLLVVGRHDARDIARSKRLSGYSAYDFALLSGLLQSAVVTIVTPHALTEVSNLIGGGDDDSNYQRNRALAGFVAQSIEVYTPSIDLMKAKTFFRLGLSDAAQIAAAMERGTLLTADGPLFQFAVGLGVPAILFEDVRQARKRKGAS